jgi:membrane-associated phospholipid phosphatase
MPSKKTKKLKKFSPTAQLVAAIALFIVAVMATRDAVYSTLETDILNFIYGWPDWLEPFFLLITQLGSIFMLGALLLIYLYKKHYHIVLRLLLTGTLAYMLAGVAKDLWGRARPFDVIPDIISREFIVRGSGFPSGHMALATALGFTLAHYLPKKFRLPIALLVILIGISRIYLGVHAPLDIVGGFAIGWGSYALFRHVRLYDIKFGHHKLKKSRNKV